MGVKKHDDQSSHSEYVVVVVTSANFEYAGMPCMPNTFGYNMKNILLMFFLGFNDVTFC